MNEELYKMYKSGRDMVEQSKNIELAEPFLEFIEAIESSSKSLDISNPSYYERWVKENLPSEPLYFRFHRGILEDSMKTTREIYSFEALITMITCEWEFEPVSIKITPYVYDGRIGWDTHIVSAKFKGLLDQGFMPVGFLNRNPEWNIQQGEVCEVK
jgi:hypothetical protein